MSRRWSRVQNEGDLWRELLQQDGVKETIEQAIRAANRPPREDFESFAWDEAVTIAMKFAADSPEDVSGFQSYLYVGLAEWGWRSNLTQLRGRTPVMDESGQYLETPTPRFRAWHSPSFDAVTEGFAGNDPLEHQATMFARRLTPDDPLAIVIKIERLAATVDRVQRQAKASGVYTSATDDVFCSNDTCRALATIAGYCRRHYEENRRTWGTKTGKAEQCREPDCGYLAHGRGLCKAHYEQAWKRQKKTGEPWPAPCKADGCDRDSVNTKFCQQHLDEARAELGDRACSDPTCHAAAHAAGMCGPHRRKHNAATSPPCIIEGCNTAQTGARGMCRRHYMADRLRRLEQGAAA